MQDIDHNTLDRRREPMDCGAHEGLIATLGRLEEKMDAMGERQIDYIQRTVRIEGIVTNGLSHNIIDIKGKLDTFCGDTEKRIAELETFSWFRTWVNDLRTKLFKYVLYVGLAGGALYFMIRYSDDIMKKVLR